MRSRPSRLADLVGNRGPVDDRTPDRSEIVGRKGSVYYRAHSYHTKVPPEGIVGAIEHFTNPGDIVADPFCGSGMTGVACLLSGRRGVLSDLSPAAVHIARTYAAPANPEAVQAAGESLLRSLAALEANLQGIACRACGAGATTEYAVWSDVFACPRCGGEILFWTAGRSEDQQSIRKMIPCGSCDGEWRKAELRWLCSTPVVASVSCRGCGKRTQGPLSSTEQAELLALDRRAIPDWYPELPFEETREMWRGQHRDQGVHTSADFFTPRNLWALSSLWRSIHQLADERTRDALRFVFTAIVNRASRRYQWNAKRPTNVLTSTLYISSLSYEFNVFSLFRRKLRAATALFESTTGLAGQVDVHKGPAQHLSWIPDHSVDYVFTDPPFGSNIFYSDASFLWEAWLGETTDPALEAVVHKSVKPENGGKTLLDYERLMAEAFSEMNRILRPNAWASVMFHNSSDEVWSALERAIETAGFEVGAAVAFDKGQPSFKAVKGSLAGERVASFDLVLHLRRWNTAAVGIRSGRHNATAAAAAKVVVDRLRAHLAEAPPRRRTMPYVHSLAMRVLLEEGLPLEGFSYGNVEALCERHFVRDGERWALSTQETNHG